ncbi:MAG: nitroreductase family protein, partial [Candidatus Lokiarchaeota archaeon]|nr:nitroreductase family protein [Candidatus Lokiarchaeota archaeon]
KMIESKLFLKFLKERRSIRSFQDKMISNNEIDMILEAGQWTPSASNRQPWQFIIIKKKDIIIKLSELARYGRFIKEAPIVIAIVGKPHENPNWYVQDTSLASMNMMLMAWSLNIGTCWIGSLNREKAKEILGIKKENFLLTILPLGYIKGDIPYPTQRKGLTEIMKEFK